MPSYRRWRVPGGTFFFTVVTHERRRFLTDPPCRRFLREANSKLPFDVKAIVLLPDHLHMLMVLPAGEDDYSARMAKIKRNFTEAYLDSGGSEGRGSAGRDRQRYRGVWEKRYYEHWIRDYQDFKLHLDYIHVNPVKHGLVSWPREWEWSTFQQYVKSGEYDTDWRGHVDLPGGTDIEPDTW